MFGGVSAIAKPAFDQLAAEISELQRKWLLVADIFQMTVDMAFDERIALRRGPSVSKAVDLCEIERGLPGHSQLRGAWSEFRDVAHLLTAGAYLAREALTRAGSADESSILNAVWIAPDVVLALAYGLQEFGLQPKSIRKESPILRPNTLWRLPDCHKLEKPFVVFRRLSDTQLEFLNSRRVAKKGCLRPILRVCYLANHARATLFGTRGSQVQILPLRPILRSFAPGHSDRFPDRNPIGLESAATARLHFGNVVRSPGSPREPVSRAQ